MPPFAGGVRVSVDIGGTFTDLQILDEFTGETHAHKLPTTPADPSEGLIAGLSGAAERFGFRLDQVRALLHGTTIATNAVLERKLPAGALVTTAGFEDVLEIGRHVRREVYGNKAEPRPLLIARRHRFGLAERIDARGNVVEAPAEAGLTALVQKLARSKVETVAVCLLHAYANPAHERLVRDRLKAALPDLPVSLSCEASPEIREFERSSTTVLNALLMPVVGRYLARLRQRLAAAGLDLPVYLVQSNGGVTTPETAAAQPVRLLLSGPSGGALASETLSRELGLANLVGIDMGGTSFDVSVVHAGRTRLVNQGEVDGLPVRLPMIEIRTIGAGGGSIARADATGRLRVGPESAGAVPGPACYARGGKLATVTDANLVLGRIDPRFFLGGQMGVDEGLARAAVEAMVARPLGLSLEQAADGIVSVANANMAAAIRLSLFEKGLDPEDFVLVSFGGAGGLHACAVAEDLGAASVLFPRDHGTLSAWGMLFSDIVHDLARSKPARMAGEAAASLAALAGELREEGARLLLRDRLPKDRRDYRLAADLRYRGQAYEITVPWRGLAPDPAGVAQAVADFHDLHERQYAHAERHAVPELVTLRLSAIGRLDKPKPRPFGAAAGRPTERRVHAGGGWRTVPIWQRALLAPGAALAGPAVVEEAHATHYIPPGWRLAVLASGELLARTEGAGA